MKFIVRRISNPLLTFITYSLINFKFQKLFQQLLKMKYENFLEPKRTKFNIIQQKV